MTHSRGFSRSKLLRTLIALSILIGIAVWNPDPVSSLVRGVFHTVLWPFEKSFSFVAFELRDARDFVSSIGELKRENESLADENLKLLAGSGNESGTILGVPVSLDSLTRRSKADFDTPVTSAVVSGKLGPAIRLTGTYVRASADGDDTSDETLTGKSRGEREGWAVWVMRSLLPMLSPGDVIVSYLGAAYAEFLVPWLRERGYTVEEPLKGMKPGPRMAWFKRRLMEVA